MQFVDVMCVTVVVTALPDMVADFDGSAADSTMIATAYAAFFGGLLLFGARVGQRIGHRRSILASIALFAIAAAIAAMSPSALVLAGARAVQGGAAACAVPSALTLLSTHAPDEHARAKAVAVWSASGAAAGISGYAVGGALTQIGDWRLIFWSLVLVSALLAVVVRAAVPADPPQPTRQPFNAFGALTATGAVMLTVVGASVVGEGGYRSVVLLIAAAVTTAIFISVDRRSASPLIPAALARLRTVRWGSTTAFVNTATTSGVATVLTLHLQGAQGYSPAAAAVTLLPLSVMVIFGATAAGRLDRSLGAAAVGTIGMMLIAFGIAVLAGWPEVGLVVVIATTVMGCGLGMSSVASTATALSVPDTVRAAASGLVNTAAQLGTALGTAALLLLAASFDGEPNVAGASAPRIAWVAAAVLATATAAMWMTQRGSSHRGQRLA
ncbi:MFS transporter [Nocardia fluminea]|uniref:MFS transporter n=1 Tax=Nocardia fluminea TaxID=134984 RepID=UPI001475BDC4|nr:MFS transporter [Nocardia fluminea]